jgi:hypothetical protein
MRAANWMMTKIAVNVEIRPTRNPHQRCLAMI